jgi:DNA-binding IclR family transcriptional regulator
VGCRDLARILDLDPARVNRLLMTFEEEGILIKNAKKKYLPGPGIYVLSAQCLQHSVLMNQVFKAIESLPVKKYTLAFGFLWQTYITYLFHGVPGSGLSKGMHKTNAYYALDSSIGQILLAYNNKSELEEIFGKEELKKFEFNQEYKNKLISQDYCTLIREDKKPKIYSIATTIKNYPFAGVAITNVEVSVKESEVIEELFQIKNTIESFLI